MNPETLIRDIMQLFGALGVISTDGGLSAFAALVPVLAQFIGKKMAADEFDRRSEAIGIIGETINPGKDASSKKRIEQLSSKPVKDALKIVKAIELLRSRNTRTGQVGVVASALGTSAIVLPDMTQIPNVFYGDAPFDHILIILAGLYGYNSGKRVPKRRENEAQVPFIWQQFDRNVENLDARFDDLIAKNALPYVNPKISKMLDDLDNE